MTVAPFFECVNYQSKLQDKDKETFQAGVRASFTAGSTHESGYRSVSVATTSITKSRETCHLHLSSKAISSDALLPKMGLDPTPKAVPKAPVKSILKPTSSQSLQPGSDGQGAPKAWTGSSGNALRSSFAAARNPSKAPARAPTAPRTKSVVMADTVTVSVSGAGSRVDRLQDDGPRSNDWQSKARSYDPSVGPSRSTMTTPWRRNSVAGSRVSNARSVRNAVFDDYCRMSAFTRRDFRLGDVIAAPFHTSNTNPNYKVTDRRITFTVEGPAYSKRRMMVVVFIYLQDLYCLPLYSFEGKGLRSKPEYLRKEYVCMSNVEDRKFVNQGKYPPVQIQARHPVNADTTVHLTGGLRVGCNEDITHVGRLTMKSYFELVELWEKTVEDARKESW